MNPKDIVRMAMASGIIVTYEYPGYFEVPLPNGLFLQFGENDEDEGWHADLMESDGCPPLRTINGPQVVSDEILATFIIETTQSLTK